MRLSFDQHKEFAVSLKGVQQKRTISDAFEQSSSGETLVNLMDLDLLVGSGGVLSHAPRREQATRMLIDSFLPEGITRLAVDSIFMMPQLGVLSTVHKKAALEVFEKDCLIELGSCVAPVGKFKYGQVMLTYEISLSDEKVMGEILAGEIKLIPSAYVGCSAVFTPGNGLDLGNGKNEAIQTEIYGGVVGILLDGRGRQPFAIPVDMHTRVEKLSEWSLATNEYPQEDK